MELTISNEELRKRSLFIGVPMYGGKNDYLFASGLAGLTSELAMRGIASKTFILSNESLIPRARNYIADEFMRSGMSHLLFIDADIGFKASDVMTLLAVADPQSDYDIVCGAYSKKSVSWEKIKRAVDAGVADQNPNELENYVGDFVISLAQEKTHVNLGEPIEVMEAGTGFMLIQRKAFERVADKFPAYLYRPDHGRSQHFDGSRKIMNYFHCDIDYGSTDQDMWDLLKDAAEGADVAADATNLLERKKQASLRYLSEDYWFCHRASDSGSKIWLLPWLRLQHVGMHVYGGDIAKMAALGVSLTYDPSDKVQK